MPPPGESALDLNIGKELVAIKTWGHIKLMVYNPGELVMSAWSDLQIQDCVPEAFAFLLTSIEPPYFIHLEG